MITRLQSLLLALTIGLTVALTWRFQLESPGDGPAARASTGPDLYMEGAVIDQFDDAGALRYRLTASAIAHYPAADRAADQAADGAADSAADQAGEAARGSGGVTRLRSPVLALLQPGAPAWEARARFGEVRSTAGTAGKPRSDVVVLSEQVELAQRRGKGNVRLRTERLTIQPLTRTAQTDLPVIIDTDTGRTVAASMRGELETGRIALTSGSRQRVTTVVQSRSF